MAKLRELGPSSSVAQRTESWEELSRLKAEQRALSAAPRGQSEARGIREGRVRSRTPVRQSFWVDHEKVDVPEILYESALLLEPERECCLVLYNLDDQETVYLQRRKSDEVKLRQVAPEDLPKMRAAYDKEMAVVRKTLRM